MKNISIFRTARLGFFKDPDRLSPQESESNKIPELGDKDLAKMEQEAKDSNRRLSLQLKVQDLAMNAEGGMFDALGIKFDFAKQKMRRGDSEIDIPINDLDGKSVGVISFSAADKKPGDRLATVLVQIYLEGSCPKNLQETNQKAEAIYDFIAQSKQRPTLKVRRQHEGYEEDNKFRESIQDRYCAELLAASKLGLFKDLGLHIDFAGLRKEKIVGNRNQTIIPLKDKKGEVVGRIFVDASRQSMSDKEPSLEADITIGKSGDSNFISLGGLNATPESMRDQLLLAEKTQLFLTGIKSGLNKLYVYIDQGDNQLKYGFGYQQSVNGRGVSGNIVQLESGKYLVSSNRWARMGSGRSNVKDSVVVDDLKALKAYLKKMDK